MEQSQGDGAVDFGHVGVVDFFPVVGGLVVVGIVEGDAEGVGGDADVGQGLVVAAGEVGVAGLFVFVDLDACDFAGVGKDQGSSEKSKPVMEAVPICGPSEASVRPICSRLRSATVFSGGRGGGGRSSGSRPGLVLHRRRS